jgi:hypothetical protein
MPKSSLSISESDLREVSVAVFGAFHHYLGVGVGEPPDVHSAIHEETKVLDSHRVVLVQKAG